MRKIGLFVVLAAIIWLAPPTVGRAEIPEELLARMGMPNMPQISDEEGLARLRCRPPYGMAYVGHHHGPIFVGPVYPFFRPELQWLRRDLTLLPRR